MSEHLLHAVPMDPRLAAMKKRKKRHLQSVGFDAEYPPYGFKDEKTGDYTGFDLELAEEVCNRRGWTLKKQPIDWDAKDMEINSGAIDCLWNGMTYTGRENDYTWSEPYVDNSIVIAVTADSDIRPRLISPERWS